MPGFSQGQGLTLEHALVLSDSMGYSNRLARQGTLEAKGQVLSSMSGFLPTVHAQVGAGATDDPMGAFGSLLEQRRVTMASFDPSRLNRPDAIPGWNAALVSEVPLVNLDAWQGRVAASRTLGARRVEEENVRYQTHAQVVEAWFAVLVAREAVSTWESAFIAASSHEKTAESVLRNGMANRSDVLMARVKAEEIEASLHKARTDVALARKNLGVLLGDAGPDPDPDSISVPDSVLKVFATGIAPSGTSLSQASLSAQANAARADLDRARAAFLPRLNGQARLDWIGHDFPWQHDPSWTVGIVASWTIFRGGDDWGQAFSARARLEQARIGLAARHSREDLEIGSSNARLQAALDQMDLAARSLEQAVEAHRVVSRRYEEGLATLPELFEAQSMEIRLRLTKSSARQECVSALANLALLHGRDPAELEMLTK
jgi:outer membrane protein TolC